MHGDKPSAERDKIQLQSVSVDKKSGKQILVCEDLSFGYENAPLLFRKANLRLQFGERIALVGRNGTGKSSFLGIMRGG